MPHHDAVAIPQQMQRLVGGTPDRRSLAATVAHALLTTRATTACPFHPYVIIRIGDDAAETHALYRARNAFKDTVKKWKHDLLAEELARQLEAAADRVCPHCSMK